MKNFKGYKYVKSIYPLRGLTWHYYSVMHMILFLQGVVLKRFDKFTDHFKDEYYIRKKKQKKRQRQLDQTMVRRMSKEKRKEKDKKK